MLATQNPDSDLKDLIQFIEDMEQAKVVEELTNLAKVLILGDLDSKKVIPFISRCESQCACNRPSNSKSAIQWKHTCFSLMKLSNFAALVCAKCRIELPIQDCFLDCKQEIINNEGQKHKVEQSTMLYYCAQALKHQQVKQQQQDSESQIKFFKTFLSSIRSGI